MVFFCRRRINVFYVGMEIIFYRNFFEENYFIKVVGIVIRISIVTL